MKKFLLLAAIAVSSLAANAQIGSTTSRSIKTQTTQVTRTETLHEKAYLSRIQFGFTGQRYNWQNGKDWAVGFNAGYLANIKVAKFPLYVYTGLLGDMDFVISERRHMSFEMPFGATYRYRLGSTKIYLSPYAGFHLKLNALWQDYNDYYDEWDSYFDGDGAKRAQFGAQTGLNFDLGAFYFNFELNGDFNKAFKYDAYYYTAKCGTMGVRFRVGFVF